MPKFILGALSSAVLCYLLMKHPELVREGLGKAREQVGVAARNITHAAAASNSTRDQDSGPIASSTVEVDMERVKALVADMKSLSHEQLWEVMDESDFDRRTAAGRVLLRRADLPPTAQGVTVVQQRYLRSRNPDELKTGFGYLGLLAQQGVPQESIVPAARRFIERNPRHEACDYAVWALGEIGSEDLVPYFFSIIEDPGKYGPAARERAFCCLAQCGRYVPERRLEMVPDFIHVYEKSHDAQTRDWSLQALAFCAPGVRARSISDWKNWWARQ